MITVSTMTSARQNSGIRGPTSRLLLLLISSVIAAVDASAKLVESPKFATVRKSHVTYATSSNFVQDFPKLRDLVSAVVNVTAHDSNITFQVSSLPNRNELIFNKSSHRQARFGTVTVGLNELPSYTVTSAQLAEMVRIVAWAGVVAIMVFVLILPGITITWKPVFCQYTIVDCLDDYGIPLYRPDFVKAFVIDVEKTVKLNEKNSVRRKRRRRSDGGAIKATYPNSNSTRLFSINGTAAVDDEPDEDYEDDGVTEATPELPGLEAINGSSMATSELSQNKPQISINWPEVGNRYFLFFFSSFIVAEYTMDMNLIKFLECAVRNLHVDA